jgi:hypothetical protein
MNFDYFILLISKFLIVTYDTFFQFTYMIEEWK